MFLNDTSKNLILIVKFARKLLLLNVDNELPVNFYFKGKSHEIKVEMMV
jgi:hypothetical protein